MAKPQRPPKRKELEALAHAIRRRKSRGKDQIKCVRFWFNRECWHLDIQGRDATQRMWLMFWEPFDSVRICDLGTNTKCEVPIYREKEFPTLIYEALSKNYGARF